MLSSRSSAAVAGERSQDTVAAAPQASRLRPGLAYAAVITMLAVVGAIAGLVLGLATKAHGEVAGNQVSVRLVPGQQYDRVDVAGALVGERRSSRQLLGEPIGIRATIDIDADYLFDAHGIVNSDVLPAYLQAFSDPEQVAGDVRSAVVRHLVWAVLTGAVIGALVGAAGYTYRRWRARYDADRPGPARAIARAYRAPERRFARRAVLALVVLATLGAVPSAARSAAHAPLIRPDPILADTPLAGTQLTGLLRPAIGAIESYVHTYFADTDAYYQDLRNRLRDQLAASPVELPTGTDVTTFGFVTDRHCNIGMDRVIVALLKHFDITTLVSGGDDAFSGSFPFESACTGDLAGKSRAAGITPVFAAGNHDSPQTLVDEHKQRVRVLDNAVVTVGGLHFLGSPDPRTSRYGEGIVPAATADQHFVLDAQASKIAELACAQDDALIVVLHDPRAGEHALRSGCGKAVLALDGHTHTQTGPAAVPLPDGTVGSQFVGGSSGGAPNENSVEHTFASALTVGPLNHDATVNLVSYDTATHRLVGVTVFRFTPEQLISVEQLTP
ncbi:MAG: hypothetical protein QOC66_3251 [Pseudonocardiales bacterium]|nr:hypothetical protein [Pseudonocardiales bacterium]